MKYLYILISVVLLFSCSQKQPDYTIPNTIKVDLENPSKPSFFDLFTDMEVIPLETTDECIMSAHAPYKFILHNNRYYCLDAQQKCIFIFDDKGKFIKKIKKEGQGPGEYTTLDDFTINRFTGNLELISSFGTINIYDSLGVEFKEKISLPLEDRIIHNMENLTEDIYVFYNAYRKKEEKVFFYSKSKGEVLADTYAVPDIVSEMPKTRYSPFYIYNDRVFFNQGYNGQIFEVDENLSFQTRYNWDMGEHTFSLSLIPVREGSYDIETKIFYKDFLLEANSKYAISFVGYAESDKYYFTSFGFNKKGYTLKYNKETGENIVIDRFKEDFWLLFSNFYDNSLYYPLSVEMLQFGINPDILDDENRKKYDSIKETDNPILLKMNLK